MPVVFKSELKLGEWKVKTMTEVGAYLRTTVINSLVTAKKMTVATAPTLEMSHAITLREKVDKALGNKPRQYGLTIPSLPGRPPKVSDPQSLLRQVIFKVAQDGNSVKVGPIGKDDKVPQLLEKGGTAKIRRWPSPYARLGVDVVTIDGQRTYGRVMGERNGTLQYLQVTPAPKRAGKKGSIFRFIAAAKAQVAKTSSYNASLNLAPRPYLQPALDRAMRAGKFQELIKQARIPNG